MIRNRIVRDYSKYARAYGFSGTDHDTAIARLSLKEQMRINAINDNGIFKTFCFSDECYNLTLDYIKIEDEDIELYPDMFEKELAVQRISYLQTDDKYLRECYKDILGSCIMYNQTGEIDDKLQDVLKEIKEKCAKKFNAVYSTVKIDNINIYEVTESIFIYYSYYSIKNKFIDKISSYDVIFGKAPLPYGEWFIDYSGPWPADRPRKESIARTKDVDLDKECIDCSAHDPKIIIANPNQNFTIDDDKLCMSLKYGKYTSYSLIMTKEVFQECYNRWIKPQEEDKSIEKCEVKYEA